ncbi:selenoneine biosynthesis selenosugar synthase SenB [Methylobacterium komagatae]|uniref:Selenoneine biosynthesis selenosugar synthase SenB n=1 Tax=Methylobacterium komagatae TaxID=374425 RepID=A0ABW2BII1_9HYPH
MRIAIATPIAATRRTGNRATATRWAGFLGDLGHEALINPPSSWDADALIALHAWRSAEAVAQFRATYPNRPVVVVLTGTDLYHFLESEPEATLRGLDLADRLVGLHDEVARALPKRFHTKLRVIHQSARGRAARETPDPEVFEVLVVGHLRPEKDPFRTARAARHLRRDSRIRVLHLGGAHEPTWAETARREMQENPRYVWLGDCPPSRVRRLMARARLMALSSLMEGGANVISEAVVSGLPVLASRIDGSVGLLGPDYPGYFPPSDTNALARLLARAEDEPAFLGRLAAACAEREPLFHPERERAKLGELLAELR